VADAEMSGERVAMTGFWIDEYLYPNEAGALPKTGVSQIEAMALCSAQSKRLCTELELERACKGPGNTTHPWGDVYRASACGSGTRRASGVPNGFFGGCRSAFGVHDLVGNAWSWTSSDWERGDDPGFVALRGGVGTPGELLGRCAHADRAKPTAQRPDLGVRCCEGPTNTARIELSVLRGNALVLHHDDAEAERAMEVLVPAGAPDEGPLQRAAEAPGATPEATPEATPSGKGPPGKGPTAKGPPFDVEHVWTWRPLGNEELRIGGGCDTTSRPKRCGLVIGRPKDGGLEPLAFAATDRWTPTLSSAEGARVIWVYGGDRAGAFRKRVAYDWGRISIGTDKERKKKRKGKKAGWD